MPIHNPYAPAGQEILNTELNNTTLANIQGAIYFLTVPNEKII
jgi:hypothetical protein